LEQELNSLDAQRQMAERYLADQPPGCFELLSTRFDEGGFSGGTMERPSLQRLIKEIKAGLIDCVVVYKLDRLCRSARDFYALVDLFKEHDVKLISLTEHFDTSGPHGQMQMGIMAVMGQFERELTASRIKDKYMALLNDGIYPYLHMWMGYVKDKETGRFRVDPQEAEVVRFIFRKFLETESMAAVTREVQALGYLTRERVSKTGKARGGQPLNQADVRRILRSPVYAGLVPHNGLKRLFKGKHQPIITQEKWEAVQKILEGDVPARQGRARQRALGCLRDIAWCGSCDTHMRPTYTRRHGNVKYRYYVCYSAAKRGYETCPNPMLNAEMLEQEVLGQVGAAFHTPEVFAQTLRSAKRQLSEAIAKGEAELQATRESLAGMETELARRCNGGAPIQEYESYREEDLRRLVAERRAAISKITEELKINKEMVVEDRDLLTAFEQIQPVWDELFPQEQQRVMRLLLKRVVVHPDRLELMFHLGGLRSLVTELRSHNGIGE
jgi:site-specific DNA recombinase